MAKDAIPAIPAVPRDIQDPQQRQFMQAVKDALTTRAGQTKNKLDYSPTIRELRDAGVLAVVGGDNAGGIIIRPDQPGSPWDDITVPDAPTGLIVNPTPWMHHVQWDVPQDATESIMSHTEVWSSDDNNRDNAVLVGSARYVISLPIDPEAHKWYWVRFISFANIIGPWSSGRTDGVEAISGPDPGTLLDWLNGKITEGELYQDLNDRIDWIDITDGGLVSRVTTAEGDIISHTGLINGLTTRVTDNEGDITYNAQLITGIRTDLTDAEGDILANAQSLTLHDTRITQNGDDITAEALRIDQVFTEINHPTEGLDAIYAGVQANSSSIIEVEGDIINVESKYSVKVDANGRVAGFGLISTDNGYGEGHTEFGVSADYFWIGGPAGPDEDDTPITFVVDTIKNQVVMDAAFIKTATITGAEIKNAAIDTAHIGNAAITTAKIENAAVANAKIGNTIQSTVYSPANGEGWLIDKSGSISAAHIQIYDHNGNIIINSGKTFTDYNNTIDNSKQTFGDISGLPDYLDYAAFTMAPTGSYGDIWFEHDQPSTGLIRIRGSKLYLPTGSFTEIIDDQTLETFADSVFNHAFVFFTPRTCKTEFPAWVDGTNHRSDWFFVTNLNANRTGFEVWDGEATRLESDWIPPIDCPIVATFANSSAGGALDFFNSHIGTNLDLPADGATKTGNGNLLIDPEFARFSDTSSFSGDPNWKVVAGAFSSFNDTGGFRGRIPYSTGTSQDALQAVNLVEVKEGSPLYLGICWYIDSPVTGNAYFFIHWFNKMGQQLPAPDDQTIVMLGTIDGDLFDTETHLAMPPYGASYAQVGYATDTIAGGNIYLDYIYAGTAPTEINPETTRSFIKDLSVDTLQIKGQAVTHSQYTEKLPAWSFDTTVTPIHTASIYCSGNGIPMMLDWSMTCTGDYDHGRGNHYFQIKRNGVELVLYNQYYRSSNQLIELRSGHSQLFFDLSLTEGWHTYEFFGWGSDDAESRAANFRVTWTELKR